jgi:hypothetical protein
MATKKPQSRPSRSASGGRTSSRKGTTSRSRARTSSGRTTSSSRKTAKPRKRSTRRQPTQPKSTVNKTVTKVVGAVRSANGPALAAAATATVVGGVALRARRRSRGLDVHGVVKQIGKIGKNVGKTSKQVSKDVHQLGDDVERAGKALS